MSKGFYVGSANLARTGKKLYLGDGNNLARKVKKWYVGDGNGLARLGYLSSILPEYKGTISGSSVYDLAAASTSTRAIFGGGYIPQNGSTSSTVFAYDTSLTKSNLSSLSVARRGL